MWKRMEGGIIDSSKGVRFSETLLQNNNFNQQTDYLLPNDEVSTQQSMEVRRLAEEAWNHLGRARPTR
jgi:hypothetical protein